MNRTDAPAKQAKPFGINGQREPLLATTPAGDNTASYDQGFPPVTMILKSAGGLPPKGQDMNQILYELSSLAQWSSAGALNTFDSGFSTAINGYPSGSLILSDDGKNIYVNTTNGNTTNPNTGGSGWKSLNTYLGLGTAAKRDVGTGVGQIPDMSSFTANIIDDITAVFTLPGGLMVQIGNLDITGQAATLTFPTPFPNRVLAVAGLNFNSNYTTPASICNYAAYWSGSGRTAVSVGATQNGKAFRYIAVGY